LFLVSRALAAARCRLVLGKDAKSAFFATLALRLVAGADWSIDTLATEAQAISGLLYNGNTAMRKEANAVYSALNEAGDIS